VSEDPESGNLGAYRFAKSGENTPSFLREEHLSVDPSRSQSICFQGYCKVFRANSNPCHAPHTVHAKYLFEQTAVGPFILFQLAALLADSKVGGN
jgi:hypothetical protein